MFSRPTLFLFSPDPTDGGGSGSSATPPDDKGGATDNQKPVGEKTFTQAELNDLIGKTRSEERKKAKQEAEDEAKKAAMSEAERLKTEKDEALKRADDAETRANARVIEAKTEVALTQAGVTETKLAYALKLVDNASVDVTGGKPDMKAILAAVAQLKADVPELFASGTSKGGAGDFNTGNQTEDLGSMSIADYIKKRESLNG